MALTKIALKQKKTVAAPKSDNKSTRRMDIYSSTVHVQGMDGVYADFKGYVSDVSKLANKVFEDAPPTGGIRAAFKASRPPGC